jgi:hypothetical protein
MSFEYSEYIFFISSLEIFMLNADNAAFSSLASRLSLCSESNTLKASFTSSNCSSDKLFLGLYIFYFLYFILIRFLFIFSLFFLIFSLSLFFFNLFFLMFTFVHLFFLICFDIVHLFSFILQIFY